MNFKLFAALLASAATFAGAYAAPVVKPGTLPKIGTVDARYQSYNLEMLEVTGGAFWRPYNAPDVAPEGPTPPLMDPKLYSYRAPKDLTNPRLRALTAALGPAYVRVSGTWANATYFADTDTPPASPPAGFNGVLTRAQWKGVVDFAKAVNAEIVTSFATSGGTRDASGVWTPENARAWIAYTHAIGGTFAAAEFANEPSLSAPMGGPKDYTPAAYGRDFKIWRDFMKTAEPRMISLALGALGDHRGPGGPSEGRPDFFKATDMMAASDQDFTAFSYHHYGAVSQRCKGDRTAEGALSEDWLAKTSNVRETYQEIRDQYVPGKAMWLTEVGDAACGGNPWGKTFLDSFRYLDQLGRLAKEGVQTVMHNTLAISDYGLLEEKTYNPRPNYWSALLWRRLMGTTVLDAGIPIQQGLHVYAQCQYDMPGGVSLLVINNDKKRANTLTIAAAAQRYTLSSPKPEDGTVRLNGKLLTAGADGSLPALNGATVKAGKVTFAPATITFLAMPGAKNPACGG